MLWVWYLDLKQHPSVVDVAWVVACTLDVIRVTSKQLASPGWYHCLQPEWVMLPVCTAGHRMTGPSSIGYLVDT